MGSKQYVFISVKIKCAAFEEGLAEVHGFSTEATVTLTVESVSCLLSSALT